MKTYIYEGGLGIDRIKVGLSATLEQNGKTYQLRVRKVYPGVREGKFRTDNILKMRLK